MEKAVKDRKGNLWAIAEDYGSPPNSTKNTNSVVRYNGKEFSYININDIGYGSYIINSLVVSEQSDDLYIATNKGLFKYDGEKITPFTSGFPLGFQAETMCSDNYGNIWIGESDGSIRKFDGEKLIVFSPLDVPFKMSWISKIYFDGRYIWVGELMGDNRLLWIDPLQSKDKLVCEKVSCPISEISDIISDKKGNLWVSSLSENIVRYKDSKWEVIDRKNSGIVSEIVAAMTLDDKGRIIFGCRESKSVPDITSGISIWDNEKWTSIGYKDSKLGLRYITSVLSDNNGNIWVYGTPGISIMSTKEPDINYELTIANKDQLFQNYPNPCNPNTTIKYFLAQPGRVQINIYDILGREIRTLVDESKEKGYYYISWNGRDNKGYSINSGIYFYNLKTESFSQTKRECK